MLLGQNFNDSRSIAYNLHLQSELFPPDIRLIALQTVLVSLPVFMHRVDEDVPGLFPDAE